MDFRFKVMGDRLRGISLGSSGDPIIHMWIMDGCVCVYTVRVVSLCVLGVFLSLLLPGSSRQAGPGTEGACARLSPTRRTEARGLLGLADGAYGGARPGEGPGGGSCTSSPRGLGHGALVVDVWRVPATRAWAPRGLGHGALVVDVWRGPRGTWAPRGLGHGALAVGVWRGPRGACAGATGSWAWRTSR